MTADTHGMITADNLRMQRPMLFQKCCCFCVAYKRCHHLLIMFQLGPEGS